jgi:hypothetical protein
MRRTALRTALLLGAGTVALSALALAACPLAHDPYETGDTCFSAADCVLGEQCAKPDGGASLRNGQCAVPSDGPCATDGGYYCYPDPSGTPRSCSHDTHDQCLQYLDAGPCPDGGCPAEWCTLWRDRWGCL